MSTPKMNLHFHLEANGDVALRGVGDIIKGDHVRTQLPEFEETVPANTDFLGLSYRDIKKKQQGVIEVDTTDPDKWVGKLVP